MPAIAIRKGLSLPGEDSRQFRTGGFQRHARLATRYHLQPDLVSPAAQLLIYIHSERQPYLSFVQESEAGLPHSDDRPSFPCQSNRPANHLRIGAETTLPELIAQYYSLRAANRVFRGHERSSDRGRDAQRRK